ncbi:hypothetical protein ACQJBY_064819 [Aegilops geniculata]
MSMRFSVVCFIVSTTGSSSGSNAGVALIVCLRHTCCVLTVDPLLLVHPGPVRALHQHSRNGGAQDPDDTTNDYFYSEGSYYYMEAADDQE